MSFRGIFFGVGVAMLFSLGVSFFLASKMNSGLASGITFFVGIALGVIGAIAGGSFGEKRGWS